MWSRNILPAILVLVLSLPAGAQDNIVVETPESEKKGWYIVRPGDTLRGITERYFGSDERWEENWKLNPGIEDPDVIQPNQHIQLLIPEKLPEGALLVEVSNKVEDQPTPLGWTKAQKYELLRSRDGVKTYEDSSAQLRFPDETLLMLVEQSIVFLTEERRIEQVDKTQIEVVVGQADLEGPAVADAAGDFEIILGDATASPRPSEDGALSTRARRPEAGGAQLMVYSGESELSAAGSKVMVATGMGSSVSEGAAPSPPEKLLPASAKLSPEPAARLANRRPTFSWDEVAGARDYVVEVCRDALCGSIVERVTGLEETKWQSPELPVSELYWRVTAVSTTGLDGYPSEARSLNVLAAPEDTTPPVVQVGFSGPHLAPRSGLNKGWIAGPGSKIEVEVDDPETGVAGWTTKIDGKEVAVEALAGPWERGNHTLTIVATNKAGQSGETEVPFVYDPDPPSLSWGVEGDPEAVGDVESEPVGSISARLRGRREVRVGKLDWQLDSDLAHVVVRPQTRKPIGLQGLGSFGPEQGLWVQASDAVCSDLQNVSYELVAGSGRNEYELQVEAVDCVGNTSQGRLLLVRDKGRSR